MDIKYNSTMISAVSGGKMTSGYIEKRLRKTNRRLILMGLLGIVLVGVILLGSISYFYNFFAGPFLSSGADIAGDAADGSLSKYFVRVRGQDALDSNIYTTTTDENGNETIDHRYFIFSLDGYKFIVLSGTQAPSLEITGQLFFLSESGLSKFEPLITELGYGDKFIPVILEPGNFRVRGYVGLFLAGMTIFFSVLLLATGIRRNRQPELHPSLKDLSRFGASEFVVSRIDLEMTVPHEVIGKVHFLQSWVLTENGAGFSAIPYDKVVWVFKQGMQNKNLGLSLGTVNALIVVDSTLHTLYLSAKPGEVDRMMTLILPHIPDAFKGYSEQLDALRSQNPQALIQAFEEKKRGNAPASTPAASSEAEK